VLMNMLIVSVIYCIEHNVHDDDALCFCDALIMIMNKNPSALN
jgi:hypothetical protein